MARKRLITFLSLMYAFFSFIGQAVALPPNATSDAEYKELCKIAGTPSIPQNYNGDKLLHVRDFGAKGDGKTNDRNALQKAASALCGSSNNDQRTTLLYSPNGKYRVEGTFDPRNRDNPAEQNVNNWGIYYGNCHNVRIVGCNSKVESDGNGANEDFHKTFAAKYSSAQFRYAERYQLIPFIFQGSPIDNPSCASFELLGFEVYGNSDHMTFDPLINAEGPDYGIMTMSCQDWRMSNLRVHHFATDGLVIGNSDSMDSNFIINAVESAYNGRHGMGMLSVSYGTITNSYFRDTGDAGIQYKDAAGKLTSFLENGDAGYSGTNAAVDIEPEGVVLNPKGGHLTFDHCHFLDNASSFGLTSAHSENIEDITVRNSDFRNRKLDKNDQTDCIKGNIGACTYPLWLNDGIAEDLVIEAERGRITLGGTSVAGDEIVFQRNHITGRNQLLYAVGNSEGPANILVQDNTFIGNYSLGPIDYAQKMLTVLDLRPLLPSQRSWRFVNNPTIEFTSGMNPTNDEAFVLGGLDKSTENTFRQTAGKFPDRWYIVYDYTQRISDHLPVNGLIPVRYPCPGSLQAFIDASGLLSYTAGVSDTCTD